VWALYREAETWSTSPSVLLGVDDEYVAYCLNQAVTYFGKSVEAKMDKAAARAKNEKSAQAARQRVLDSILKPKSKGSGFADPADIFKQ
jgi:hypothetical protein